MYRSQSVNSVTNNTLSASMGGEGGEGKEGGAGDRTRGVGWVKGMGIFNRVPFDLGSGIHMFHVALLWAWSSALENANKYKHILLIRCTIIGLMAFMLSKDYVQSVSFQTQKNLALYKKLG